MCYGFGLLGQLGVYKQTRIACLQLSFGHHVFLFALTYCKEL